jgi:predicted nuclease of predicted toxin-antitoxin system
VKLLLDQNLSYKLCDALADLYPGSTQVRLIGLDRADDLTVWRHAAREGYTLVTQDTDVRDLAALHGAPPKVVLLRCGNKPTPFIERLLRDHALQLAMLETTAGIGLLEIG